MANTYETMAPDVILRKIIDGSLTELEDDLVTSLGISRLGWVTSINRIKLSNCTSVTNSAFTGNSNLTELYVPKLRSMSSGYSGIIGSSPIHYLAMPSYSGIIGDAGFLASASNTYGLDMGPSFTEISAGNATFGGYRKYILVFRRSTAVVKAAGSLSGNCLKNSPHVNLGIKGGSVVYIPKALYDHLDDGTSLDYYAATNWSAAKNWSYFKFAQIEGSRFEFYYIDGTLVDEEVTPDSIQATLDSNPGLKFYDSMDVKYLKEHLTVTATFGQKTVDLFKEWYELEGTLIPGTRTVTVKHRGLTTTFTVNVLISPLPSGYTHIGYVYSANSSYVNTGINETGFYAEYGFREASRAGGSGCGHILSSTNVFYPKIYSENSWAMKFGTSSQTTIADANWDMHSVYHVTADYESTGAVTVNGTNIGNADLTGATFGSNKLYILSYGPSASSTSYSFAGKLFYLRLYSNNTLAHDYIPCLNTSNTAGLYDSVSQTFYGSTSSTAFSATAFWI